MHCILFKFKDNTLQFIHSCIFVNSLHIWGSISLQSLFVKTRVGFIHEYQCSIVFWRYSEIIYIYIYILKTIAALKLNPREHHRLFYLVQRLFRWKIRIISCYSNNFEIIHWGFMWLHICVIFVTLCHGLRYWTPSINLKNTPTTAGVRN